MASRYSFITARRICRRLPDSIASIRNSSGNNLPPGIAGLVTAAIVAAAMANLSAALNSLASTTVMDFLRPLSRSRASGDDDSVLLRWARWATVAWALVLVAIGIVARHWGSVLESGLSIASVTLGLLLGIFLLGVLTRRVGTERGFIWRRCGSGA